MLSILTFLISVITIISAAPVSTEPELKAFNNLQLLNLTDASSYIAEYVVTYNDSVIYVQLPQGQTDSIDTDTMPNVNATEVLDAAKFILNMGEMNDYRVEVENLPFSIDVYEADGELHGLQKRYNWDSCSRTYKSGGCKDLADTFNYNHISNNNPTFFDTPLPRSSAGLSNYYSGAMIAAAYYSKNYQQGTFSAVAADPGYTVCLTPNGWYINSMTMSWDH